MDYGVTKDPFGRLLYDPKKMVASWTAEVEFLSRNLTKEQSDLATKIINENNKGYGASVITGILNALAHAGFRGEIQHSTDFLSPKVVVINSKIEIDKQ